MHFQQKSLNLVTLYLICKLSSWQKHQDTRRPSTTSFPSCLVLPICQRLQNWKHKGQGFTLSKLQPIFAVSVSSIEQKQRQIRKVRPTKGKICQKLIQFQHWTIKQQATAGETIIQCNKTSLTYTMDIQSGIYTSNLATKVSNQTTTQTT